MSVVLEGIGKRFGPAAALVGIDLTVEDGGFLALLGPSGSGKTTLLRLIAGLETAEAGRILIGGRDMASVPARARRVGLVFQHFALFRHMNVAANVGFGLRIRPRAIRPKRAAIDARVAELLKLVQMDGYGGRYPDQLSGGQRQRIALARALAIEPRVLLLDEPFGALDAAVRRDLRRWLRGLHDRMGLTTILVTHDQTEALELADRVAVLRAGRIEQVDTPAVLWRAPANAFVHAFLGDAVRLACTVRAGQAEFKLPLDPIPTDMPDGIAEAVIRPHEIVVIMDQNGPGRVRLISAAGALPRIEIALGREVIETRPAPGAALPELGARCTLDVSAARLYPASAGQVRP